MRCHIWCYIQHTCSEQLRRSISTEY